MNHSAERYPIHLNLKDRRVLVVGGGPVATRRAHDLAHAGARVDVVTPWACEDMWAKADSHEIRLTLREYAAGDTDGAWLVHACSGDASVDQSVADDCEAARIWCIRADDAALNRAWMPAVARAGEVTVGITAGGDPRRAQGLRDAVRESLLTGELPLRRQRAAVPGQGWVALVGGGPGDPDLITARGRFLLAHADVVVVDRLAPRALLLTLPDDVEVIEAGKGPDAHTLTQDQINETLVDRARQGSHVVRLKGGDPFVLGRGGEEVLACAAAGIPVEVVPGVTSAVAVPAAGGVPVTHRGVSSQFTVLSAHDDIADVVRQAPEAGTLIVLMGVGRLEALADGLLGRGYGLDTPVAVIERGTLPDQQVTTATLSTIAARAESSGVASPAVIVIGDVAALVDSIGTALTRVVP